jgi:alanyl-tRNA synthetase
VQHTGELGRFRILKEEAVGRGVRRIRAVLE